MSRYSNYDYLLRLAMIGDSGVGKSALLGRIADGEFTGDYISTIGVDFALKMFNLNQKTVKLQIWDTAGQERFHNITMSYYRSVDAIILVYDVCQAETFANIPKWFDEAKENSKNGTQILLVGNKCDKSKARQVPYHQAQNLAESLHIPLFETSAKDATNVTEAFNQIVDQTIKCKLDEQNNSSCDKNKPGVVDPAKGSGNGEGIWKCCTIL